MLICLDYDGVLVDTFDELLAMMVAVQARIGRGRVPVAEDLQSIEQLTFLAVADRIGLRGEDVDRFAEGMFELQSKSHSVRPFPGIPETLATLSRQHTLAVVTANHADTVTARLSSAGLFEAISLVSGAEGGESKAERIDALRRRFGFEREHTVMVGDAISDIRAGREAGVTTAAVTWGYQARAWLAKASPDVWLAHPGELLTLVPGASRSAC